MKILFAAGGTGGHINPALATAGEIRERYPDAEILFVGTKDKMEAKLVPQAGFAFEGIAMSGFQRKISFENIIKNIKTVWRVLFSGFAVKRTPEYSASIISWMITSIFSSSIGIFFFLAYSLILS